MERNGNKRLKKKLVKAACAAIQEHLVSTKNTGNTDINTRTSLRLNNQIHELVLIGYVCIDHDDGRCIAVLNPTPKALKELKPSCSYSSLDLRKIVSNNCQAMVQVDYEVQANNTKVLSWHLPKQKMPQSGYTF